MKPELRRPDLEMMEVNPDFPYIGPQVMPIQMHKKQSGTIYYMPLPSDSAAQTNRSPAAAPTRATNSTSSDTFSCAELIKRADHPVEDVSNAGGEEPVYRNLTVVAKRSIMRGNEARVVAATLNNTNISGADIGDSLLQAIDAGLAAIHRYPGKKVLAMGWTTFRRICRYSEVTNVLLRTGVVADTAEAIRRITPLSLATILGVDEVLVGDDDHWTAGKAFLFKQADGASEPTMQPQLGRLVTYAGEEIPQGCYVEAWYDMENRAEVVDGTAYTVAKVFNAGAGYRLYGIDEGNVVTTTTTN